MKTIASHNAIGSLDKAWGLLKDGAAPLDSVIESITAVEDDPRELTVGYGSLPNEEGVVQLDAAVMDGPTHRGAAVAALEGVRHPTRVARLLMQQTNRALLVGEGALRFALANGFQQENLLTEKARQMWLYWKRTRSQHDDWLPPEAGQADLEVERWFEKHFYGDQSREGSRVESADAGSDSDGPSPTGTVHCSALDAGGDLACATSTGGHAFKMSGRVGDSPILGAGLYVDNEVGTCGSIGYGEANQENLSSFAAVELMRGGRSPVEAGLEVLRRVANHSHPWQRDEQGRPKFNLQLFLLAKDGAHAGVSMWDRKQIAVADEAGVRLEDCRPLYRLISPR